MRLATREVRDPRPCLVGETGADTDTGATVQSNRALRVPRAGPSLHRCPLQQRFSLVTT